MAAAGDREVVRVSGLIAGPREIELIREVVESCGLSRAELAATVCELLEWRRPNGRLKTREASDLLSAMAEGDHIVLPEKRASGRPTGSKTRTRRTAGGEPRSEIRGSTSDVKPVEVQVVESPEDHGLWRELIDRYHPLGYRTPFGASMRYFFWISRPSRQIAACMQLSSPAWRMQPRDDWIGWSDDRRAEALQHVVNQSRFLVLPWIEVRNLASHILGLLRRRLAQDWQERFGLCPWLLETLVDRRRYAGTCYQAAGWSRLGVTSGRGRMDRAHARHGEAPKWIFVRELVPEARQLLQGEA